MNDTASLSVYNVLFICTHNSARSIMAEALMRGAGAPRFQAYSAGSHPAGTVQPLALSTLRRMGVDDTGLRSKDWVEFAQPEAPQMHFVFTVCDNAAGEVCPLWPGQPMTAHWGMPDPSATQGSEDEIAQAYWNTAITLKRRIDLMLALPMASLDRLALQREIRAIGSK